MRRFVCPSCGEVTSSAEPRVACRTCGDAMAPLDGCLHVSSVPDRPGALARFLKALGEREINVTALRVIARRNGEAHVLFSVDKVDAAIEIAGVRRAEEVLDFAGVSFLG